MKSQAEHKADGRPRVVAIIEARMASTRLPGKVLLPIAGSPVIEHIIRRLQQAKTVDEVCLATTDRPDCDELAEFVTQLGVLVYRGSEDDVLDRVLGAANYSHADVIVEICGDCPLIDPTIVDATVNQYFIDQLDFCSNAIERAHPIGLDVKVFSTSVLQDVAQQTDDPHDHEHVSLYIYEHPQRYRLGHIMDSLDANQISHRLTLDTPEDLALIRKIYDALISNNPYFLLQDILILLEKNPTWLNVNKRIRQKGVRE